MFCQTVRHRGVITKVIVIERMKANYAPQRGIVPIFDNLRIFRTDNVHVLVCVFARVYLTENLPLRPCRIILDDTVVQSYCRNARCSLLVNRRVPAVCKLALVTNVNVFDNTCTKRRKVTTKLNLCFRERNVLNSTFAMQNTDKARCAIYFVRSIYGRFVIAINDAHPFDDIPHTIEYASKTDCFIASLFFSNNHRRHVRAVESNIVAKRIIPVVDIIARYAVISVSPSKEVPNVIGSRQHLRDKNHGNGVRFYFFTIVIINFKLPFAVGLTKIRDVEVDTRCGNGIAIIACGFEIPCSQVSYVQLICLRGIYVAVRDVQINNLRRNVQQNRISA